MLDPRLYQIAVLTGLLTYGMSALGFDVTPGRAAITLAASLLTQLAGARLTKTRFEWKSALITGLSLCLLLRTNSHAIAALAAIIAMGSKFAIRWNGKHVFNPSCLAIVVALALGSAWTSPGQWGNAAIFAFLMACAGGIVASRSWRADIALAFLATRAAMLLGRSAWLGEPFTIPLHRIESGSLLLFAFFMISDPRTTPDSRAGRLLFAALVAAGGHYVQFTLFRQNGLFYSLAFCSILVPLIDRLLPDRRFEWSLAQCDPSLQPSS